MPYGGSAPRKPSQDPMVELMAMLGMGGGGQSNPSSLAEIMGGGSNPFGDFFSQKGPGPHQSYPQQGNESDLATLLLGPMREGGNSVAGPAGPKRPGQEMSDLQRALAEIDAMINAQAAGGDNSALQAALHQATSGINQAYGGQIAGIRDLNQGAREDTAVGSKKVDAMYRALNRSYRKAGQQEKKAGLNTSKQLQQLGAQSSGAATNAAAKLNAQNVAAAQALGSPDIAAQLNAEVNQQQQGVANQAIDQTQRAARTALGTSDNERKYYNTQGTTARLEGTNRAADMYAQLQDYLDANRNKISEIQGQKAAALAGAKAEIGGAFQNQQSDILSKMIEQKMALLRMAEDSRQFDQSNMPEPGEDPMKDLIPENIYNSNALTQQAPPDVQTALQQLLNDPAMATGQWTSGDDTYQLQNNPAALQQWLLDNRETDSFENDPAKMQMLVNILLARLQGHPGAVNNGI